MSILKPNHWRIAGLILALTVSLALPGAAWAQAAPGAAPVELLEREVEITQVDAQLIYTGVEKFPFALTPDTVVIGPDGAPSTLGFFPTPFMAVIKYSLPVGGAEDEPAVVHEIGILEDLPR